MEEEDGASDEWAILSKELETWAVVWEMVREAKMMWLYIILPQMCVLMLMPFIFTSLVCLCGQLWNP